MKDLLLALEFSPKENTQDICSKKYPLCGGYELLVDYRNERIEYGTKIQCDSKTTQNFAQSENWVVLECVDRLLMKGYQPEDISLEKVYPSGHGTSGRLDILVSKEGKAYMMIECKTWGGEFDKEWKNIQKKGGQLFTYFQQDRNTDFLVLYTSCLDGKEVQYKNEIIKIESDYRLMGNVEDLYNRWNKFSKQNGIFESWARAYHFESKALTPGDLKEIRQEDSSFIFNQFLEILRHNTVSDKGNAFNRIFTLFLCKVYDEKTTKSGEELKFQWLEGIDTHMSFQIRLTDLYKNGMLEFLSKQVTDFSEDDFEKKYKHLDDSVKKLLLEDFFRVRVEKNNEFAIKDVFDHQSFEENAKVVKEVVELLQKYRIRYNKRQQYLSDFFELLLTTGLKQESGQFFTPVPLAQFVIKSLPIDQIIREKIERGEKNNLLPYIIDYAAGSGHFLTESMHEVQGIINQIKPLDYIEDTTKKIKSWQEDHFDWATQYVYGIEKDYRLVKVGKVGCYLHGDGLANVILSDGLARFSHPEYKGKLRETDTTFPQDNKQFDIVISNPPYSVSSFANTSGNYYTKEDFQTYQSLTESSSEIESLFIERMKQLLKDGGIAGIILPSSILSNSGIYTRSREMILEYFDIIAITELGSNTFMATGTNTVVLFLRRRNNYESINLRGSIDKYLGTLADMTINRIENPVSKYVAHVWGDISIDDYNSLLRNTPNERIQEHEIYREYQKKFKAKNEKEFFERVIKLEKDKLFHFVSAYPQTVVLVKSGEKDREKKFLGYEFSQARGREGIHPIQKGKFIDECTQMFDPETFENPEKASTYIYKAFTGDFSFPVHESISSYVSRVDLVDMMTWDRVEFEKTISTSVKKKIKIESKWDKISLGEIAEIINGFAFESAKYSEKGMRVIRITNVQKGIIVDNDPKFHPLEKGLERFEISEDDLLMSLTGNVGRVGLYPKELLPAYLNQRVAKLEPNSKALKKYLFSYLNTDICEQIIIDEAAGLAQKNLSTEWLKTMKIPLPPLDIQQKIVDEMEEVEKREDVDKHKLLILKRNITHIIPRVSSSDKKIDTLMNEGVIFQVQDGNHGEKHPKSSDYVSSGIPFIMASDLQDNNLNIINCKFVSQKLGDTLRIGFAKEGDILLTHKGSIGFCDIVSKLTTDYIMLTPQVTYYRINIDKILPKFLKYYFLSDEFQDELKNLAKEGQSTRDYIGITKQKQLKIPLPPLSEQHRIVTEIEKIETEIGALESELASIPVQKETILKKYL